MFSLADWIFGLSPFQKNRGFDTSNAKKTKKIPIDLHLNHEPWMDWCQPGIHLVFVDMPSPELSGPSLEQGNRKTPQRYVACQTTSHGSD